MPIPLVEADSPNMKCPSGGVVVLNSTIGSVANDVNMRLQSVLSGRGISFTPLLQYHRNSDRVMLECVCGHKWDSSVKNIITGYGCPKCARRKLAEQQRLSIDDVNNRLKEASKGRYSFKEVIAYKNGDQHIECECLVCRHKWSNKYVHLVNRGQGCPKCAGTLKPTYDEALHRLTEVAKDRYTFEMGVYKNQNQKVKCKCLKCHHEWRTRYCNLLKGRGCVKCGYKDLRDHLKLNYDEALARLNKVSYGRFIFTLDREQYAGLNTIISCRCLSCNYIWATKITYLTQRYSGCPECAKDVIAQKQRKELDTIIHNLCCVSDGRFAFTLGQYDGFAKTRVECVCYKCGCVWNAKLTNLIYLKNGCPNQCYVVKKRTSKPEPAIANFITEKYPALEVQQSVKNLIRNPQNTRWMELDIYIPELKLAFEFNGTYWHSDKLIGSKKNLFTSAQQYHDYKTEQCKKLGIKLIHIDEAEWKRSKSDILQTINKEVFCAYTVT